MLAQIKRFLKSKNLTILFVVVSYLFFTAYYMGPSLWSCKDTLYGFGDNTGGVIRQNTFFPNESPLGGFDNMTNFPVGEDSFSPANYSGVAQFYMIRGASKMLGPVCGYNAINVLGFVLSALVMYGFIYTLTKNKWIAWLSGYAVSFTPYYQYKVGVHDSYGYQAFLIAAVWALFNLIKNQRKRDVAYLGLITAFCFYWDPYFSLLAASILSPLIVTWLIILIFRRHKKSISSQQIKKQIILILQAAILIFALISPLIFIAIKDNKQITNTVAATRGSGVFLAATLCSNRPYEYFEPVVFSAQLAKAIEHKYRVSLHSGQDCGPDEDYVGISLVLISVTIVGLVDMTRRRFKNQSIKADLRYDSALIVLGMISVILFGVLLALPPIKLFGIMPLPSYLLLKITTTWRILSRLYVVINIASITVFAAVVSFYSRTVDNKKFTKVIFVLALLIFFEYQVTIPFTGSNNTFSYKNSTPPAYLWLSQQDDTSTIAEYPMRKMGESAGMTYYLSMQVVHRKKLFNANTPLLKEEGLKDSLRNISDPQTVQVLGALGVDAVVIHGVSEETVRSIDGLEVVYSSPTARIWLTGFDRLAGLDNMVIAKVRKNHKTEMLALGKGFKRNKNIIKSAVDWVYDTTNNGEMTIEPLPGSKTKSNTATLQCFDIAMANQADKGDLSIIADGIKINFGELSSEFKPIKVMAKNNIIMSTNTGNKLRLKKLGCPIDASL